MNYDPENVFAKILRGELPSHKVYEDDQTFAFMDVFPQTRGHTLVIPKAETTNFFDIEPDVLAGLIQKTQTVAKAVKAALNPDGVRIMQLNGTPAGQTVFHIHFHILPVWEGQDMGRHAAGGKADDVELAELANLIKAQL